MLSALVATYSLRLMKEYSSFRIRKLLSGELCFAATLFTCLMPHDQSSAAHKSVRAAHRTACTKCLITDYKYGFRDIC